MLLPGRAARAQDPVSYVKIPAVFRLAVCDFFLIGKGKFLVVWDLMADIDVCVCGNVLGAHHLLAVV